MRCPVKVLTFLGVLLSQPRMAIVGLAFIRNLRGPLFGMRLRNFFLRLLMHHLLPLIMI